MQLDLAYDLLVKPSLPPLKSQLLKWIGNKQRFAKEIISFFPSNFNRYYEPFLGSGAVLATLSPSIGIGSDSYAPLIEIWLELRNNPEGLKRWYRDRYELLQKCGKENAYEIIKKSFNKKPNGADFIFLSRSCYGGVIRFRMKDGYMSTPCGVHDPIAPKSFDRRVDEWYQRIENCDFFACDFSETMERAT
jgi:DNA adenine methylase